MRVLERERTGEGTVFIRWRLGCSAYVGMSKLESVLGIGQEVSLLGSRRSVVLLFTRLNN